MSREPEFGGPTLCAQTQPNMRVLCIPEVEEDDEYLELPETVHLQIEEEHFTAVASQLRVHFDAT